MYWNAVFLVLILITACTPDTAVTAQRDFQPRSNYLTMGDAAKGRAAFFELKCNVCHDVAGEPLAFTPQSSNGPALGSAEASQSPDEIARAIAAPGHSTSKKPGPWRDYEGPRMAEFSHVMTVRQLMDLVAYIRSLPGGTHDGFTRAR